MTGRPQIVVAGSGKMARDVGLYFLGRGHPVAWLSRDRERLEALRRWVLRRHRRLLRDAGPGDEGLPGEPSFHLVGERDVPRADLFIECINEAEDEKRRLMETLEEIIPDDALRVSNSSSIQPDALHSHCAGLHFFYPVELTGLVEVVFPDGFDEERRARLRSLLDATNLECIEEEPGAAFAVNRLLLPLQAEVMQWVRGGYSPVEVDRASASEVLQVGQLALMDTIGLDVVYPAVCNFAARLDGSVAKLYEPLREGLSLLLDLGKRGKKNRDGLLTGSPLPWSLRDDPSPPGWLHSRLSCLFANSCAHALERGLLDDHELEVALASLFDWRGELADMVAPLDLSGAAEVLVRAWQETGRAYFIPFGPFRSAAAGRDWPDTGLLL